MVIVVVGRGPLILVVVMGWCCLWCWQGGGGGGGGSGTLSWSLLQLAAVVVAIVVCGISLAPPEIQKDIYCTVLLRLFKVPSKAALPCLLGAGALPV